MTDTAAYSDVVFGLFRLLGYQFSPRLADLGDARLWRMDRQADYGPLDGVARHRVRTDLIRENWDDPLRVAGSLKTGAVGAHEMMRVLQRGGRPSTLAKAVGEVGRVAKTLFLLVCVDDEAYRRRVLTQLNRQESRHGLARVVFHGRRGEIRKQSREGQEAQLARWASSRTRSCCGTRATSRQRWARSERRGTMSETRTWPGSRRWARSTSGCSGATTSSCPVPSRGVSCGR